MPVNFNLLGRLRYHSALLSQFYMPIAAMWTKLCHRQKETICLPMYILVSQVLFRAMLTLSVTVSLTLALSYGFQQRSRCLFSRTAMNTSYECLNEIDRNASISFESHQTVILVASLLSTLVVTPLCHFISSSILQSMVHYLSKFEDQKQRLIAEGFFQDRQPEVASFNINDPILATVGSGTGTDLPQAPSYRLNLPQRKNDSMSSFRALLGQESFSQSRILEGDEKDKDIHGYASGNYDSSSYLQTSH